VTDAPEEEPPGRVVGVLVAVEGELEGTLARVVSGSNRVGRSPECEVWLPSEWISRHHARIDYRRGSFLVEASSDKPTVLNSEPIERGELQDGDTITLGTTTLRFRSIL
jgi:pSer/pThr/pTyr-binding forkhead associated (FHA) protein